LRKYLVVLAVGLSLGIQNSGPVLGFEVELGVDINLDINVLSALLYRVGRDSNGGESTSDESSNSGWAPLSDNFSGLQVEFGSENRVLDGSVIVDLSERKRLVDGRALITKGVDRSLRVDGNADGKASGNSGGGRSRGRKILDSNARDVLKLRLELLCGKGSGSLGLLGTDKGGGSGNKRGQDGELHF